MTHQAEGTFIVVEHVVGGAFTTSIRLVYENGTVEWITCERGSGFTVLGSPAASPKSRAAQLERDFENVEPRRRPEPKAQVEEERPRKVADRAPRSASLFG